MGAPRLAPDEALLVLLFPCTTAALCDLSAATRALALASLREAISALPASTVRAPAKNAGLDAAVAALLADAKIKANTAPPSREDPPTLPTATAAAVPDIAAFVQRWGRAETKPHTASTWPKKGPATKKPELVLPAKPRRPQPLDAMPEAVAGRETFADYRRDASNPVVSPWSLPVFEWSPRRRCCFTVLSFAVANGTLEMVCSPLAVTNPNSPTETKTPPTPDSDAARATALAEVTAVATVSVCGPPITVRCLFDAELHKGRCGAVPEELVGRHVTVWDPYVFITAQGAHEVQVDSAKDIAFHLTANEIETFGIRDERDGGFALRWLRKAKADGDALMAEDPAAAVRAYTHTGQPTHNGLCMCYSRGPLDGDPTLLHALFDLSGLIASSFHSVNETLHYWPDKRVFAAAARLFFTPDADTNLYREVRKLFNSPMQVGDMLLRQGFPSLSDGFGGWRRLTPSVASVTPEAITRQAVSNAPSHGDPDAIREEYMRVLRSFPLVAEIIGDIAAACLKLRSWHQTLIASTIAGFMAAPSLADRHYGHAAVAAARLGVNVPLQVPERAVSVSPKIQSECDTIFGITNNTKPWATGQDAVLNPELTGTCTLKEVSGKGRGLFTTTADLGAYATSAVPFAFSTSADLSSIRYRDWTLPADFAGLFRVLQHRSSMPCASHSQLQQRLLVGRDDGAFRGEPMALHRVLPTFDTAPMLFHDLSLPLREPAFAFTAASQLNRVPETRLGDSFLFDAARAIEVVGTNAMSNVDFPEGRSNPCVFLDFGVALCNDDAMPNAIVRIEGPRETPVVMVAPVRPLARGEEVTLLYSRDRCKTTFNRWPSLVHVPKFPEATAVTEQVLHSLRFLKGHHSTARTVMLQSARKHLGWSAARCAAAAEVNFEDFLLDFFGDKAPSVPHIMTLLGSMGDETVLNVLRRDRRFAFVAASLGIVQQGQ